MPTPNRLLRHERKLRGWSQTYLAQQIDVPDYYISRWERGEVLPSPYYQQKLCELFGKTAEELGMLQEKGNPPVQGKQGTTPDPLVPSNPPADLFNSPLAVENKPLGQPIHSNPPENFPTTDHTTVEQLPFPPPFSLSPQSTPSADSTPFSAKKVMKQPTREWKPLILLILVLVVLATGGWSLLHLLPQQSSFSTSSSTVGQLTFLSSGQISDTSNQGIADNIQLELSPLQIPSTGKSYYAWLLPDEDKPENTVFLLGKITVSGKEGKLSYTDLQHTNLLAATSRFLVTEESTAVEPLAPSLDKHNWRYLAQIPNQHLPRETYGFLDHLRHLLAQDPKLSAHNLSGGLTPWLYRNTQAVYAQTLGARDEWQAAGTTSTAAVRQDVISILSDLDGANYVQQDLPTPMPTSTPTDTRLSSIGLLQLHAEQDPPGYLFHVILHLTGLSSSLDATPSLQQRTTQIISAINTVNAWLQQIRQDAKQLAAMTDEQFQQQKASALLNDMVTNANNALVGKKDAATGNTQEGAEWIMQSIESLATMEISPYSA
jgi:transcriptional regulator with XRE-family HTH domain